MSEVKHALWKERLPFIKTIAGFRDHWNLLSQLPWAHDRDEVRVIAFSPDGKTLVSVSDDCTVRLWDVATGAHRQTLEGHSDYVTAVVFSPDGKTLASASSDCTVRLWDVATGAHRQTLKAHSDLVTAVAFSPDGKTLVSASKDGTVRLWDVARGTQQQTLEGHSKSVVGIVFSPDGKTLASASFDRTVRLWDIATGMYRQEIQAHGRSFPHDISDLTFSEDGQYLRSNTGAVRLLSTSVSPTKNSQNHPSLLFDGDWISRDEKGVLWVPSDYPDTSVALRENTLVLVDEVGGLIFLQFDFS
jgi:WD40 repeat protein